jgi:hypothetical protein
MRYLGSLTRILQVRSMTRHAIHFQFDIRVNALKIKAMESPKYDVLLTVLALLILVMQNKLIHEKVK